MTRRQIRGLLAAVLIVGLWVGIAYLNRAGKRRGIVDLPRSSAQESQTKADIVGPSQTQAASIREEVVAEPEAISVASAPEADEAAVEEQQPAAESSSFLAYFMVVDASGEPLPDGYVTLRWGEDGLAHGVPREEDDVICIRDAAPGRVVVEAGCPGFVSRRYETLLPFDPPRVEGLMLAPAAMLTGEVRLQEGMSESLTVRCWQDVGDVQQVSVNLSKEDEGRFSLDSVPTGVVQVVAISPGRGHSDVVAVTTRPGESTHVVLEIDGGSSVVGMVLDQLTGKPLSDAEVFLMAGMKGPIAEVSSCFTDVDGRFVLRGAAAVGSFVVATAHGYSRQTRQVSGTGGEIDVGSIALPKTQSLTICLADRDNSSSTGYTIHSEDSRVPLSRFDSEGCITIEDVSAEQLECDITAPELTFFNFRAYLDPGEDWVFHVPVGGLASALVTFEGVQIEKEAELTLLYHPAPGTQLLQTVFVERLEPVVLDGLPPGEVKAYLTEGSTELGSDIATVVGTQPVELTIQGKSGVRIRVIDGSGAPVQAADVLCAGSASAAQSYAKRTDELGLCSFQLDPAGPLYAAVRHPEKGFRSATPVQPLPDRPFDLVLNPTSSLELAFHSTDGSVAGLSCMLSDPAIPFLFELSKNTDAAGVIRWDLLHDGRYFVSMFHHGFFPFEETFEVSSATHIDRTLRGRGALTFLVTDKDGLPLAEMPVALRSIVDDVSINAWIEREWLVLPPQGLQTDGLGQLTIGELASGPYEWTVIGTSGSANVLANAVVQQLVALE